MPDLRTVVETAFAQLITDLEVELGVAEGELQIVADDWTLVLDGDPITGVLIAVDDEDQAPNIILDDVLMDDHLAAMRTMNAELDGAVAAALAASPDPLAKELASRLT